MSCQFIQAELQHLDYLTKATIQLQAFESQGESAGLNLSNTFEDKIRDWLKLELATPTSLIFIIQQESSIAGFAFLKIIPSQNEFTQYSAFGLIQSLWIEPEFRGLDFGKKAVELMESIFKEQAIPYYEVNYSAFNKTAKDFWEKCGLTGVAVTARKFLS